MVDFSKLLEARRAKAANAAGNTATNQGSGIPATNNPGSNQPADNQSETNKMDNIDTTTATAEPAAAGVNTANLNAIAEASANYTKRAVKYNFRKDTLGNKRPSVEVGIPVLTLTGLIEVIEKGGTQLDLVLDTLADVIIAQARIQVDDDENFDPTKLDASIITWEAISNQPRAERKGGGIAKEQWEAFSKDYLEVMPKATGKTLEQVGNAAKILMGKFQSVKTSKKVVGHLADQLNIWLNNSSNAEDFVDCYEFLSSKADALLKADEAALLENL